MAALSQYLMLRHFRRDDKKTIFFCSSTPQEIEIDDRNEAGFQSSGDSKFLCFSFPPLDILDSCVSHSECKRGKPVPIYPVDLGCDGEKVEWPSGRRNRRKHYPVAIAVCLGQIEKGDRQGKGEKLNSKIQDIHPRPLVVIQFPDSLMHPELRQMLEGRRRRNTLHTANQLHGKENFRRTKATTFIFSFFFFFLTFDVIS